MRKALIFTFIIIAISAFGGKWMEINSSIPQPAKVDLVSVAGETTTFTVSIDGFEMSKVLAGTGEAFVISLDGSTPLLIKDCPDLPKVTASVIIGEQSVMKAEIISSSYKEFYGLEIAPSKGNLYRNVDPSTIPYVYGKVYSGDEFFPGELVGLRQPYFLRDYRGQTVIIYPFQYNPVTKVLRVYSEMVIRVSNVNPVTKASINPVSVPAAIDSEFKKIYSNHFLNFDKGAKYTPVSEQGNMLVISYSTFMQKMQEYVNWKNTIGIPTEMVDVATIGGTAAIKAYVSNYYNTQGLTFLLLVGDAAQVPPSSTNAGDSDNDYGYVVGNDHYPDLFVGRFSAETIAHVETQVDRTIDYELNPLVFPEWYNKGVGIASSEGPGDDNEMDYEHVRNMQLDLLAFTYNNCPELFDGSQGGLDAPGNPTPAMVATEVNAGSGVILYTGHGSTTSWGSSGFNNSDVNSLINLRKLPFIWSVACVNGNFVNNTCFGEAWLRATEGGEPTGAIGALMSTINQSWNPPMSGQDEMVDILVESYAYNIKRTFGGISMNGCMQMNDDYGTAGEAMTDTWNLFGDPSLVVRTDTPKVMTATHNNIIFIGATQFLVNCNVDDAYVCLTLNHQIIGTGYINGGMANINFSPVLTVDTVTVAITAFNYIPYIAHVPVIPPSGPYVIYNSHQLIDATGNMNGLADYAESITLDMEVKNVGVATANGIEVYLTSQDQYIIMTDTSEYYGDIMPDSVIMKNSAFAFNVADSIPDNHTVLFSFSATDGTNIWPGGFTIKLHAPKLNYDNYSISDPSGNNNNKLDPGETADITVVMQNSGSSEAFNVKGILSNSDPYITINTSTPQLFGNIAAGNNAQQTYSVSVSPLTPAGHQTAFDIVVNADSGYYCSTSFSAIIGQIPIMIIDMDGNNNSANEMQTAIQSLGLAYDYSASFPPDFNLYSSVFLCLGIYWDNHVLDAAEGQVLADYLNSGGCLYMEGGDTWYYDPQTVVHPMFSVNPVADGSSDLSFLNGETNTFTDGMAFNYSGDNNYIDRIDPNPPAFSIFTNQSPVYGSGVAYDQGTYKTIAASHEFGGLDDSTFPSTKQELMAQYLEFFGLYTDDVNAAFFAVPTKSAVGDTISFFDTSTGNNFIWYWSFPGGTPSWSGIQNPKVVYNSSGLYNVELIVSDGMNVDTLMKYDYIEVGCVNPFTINVTAAPSTINPGDPCQLQVIPTGGSGLYSYSWASLPPGFTSSAADPVVNPFTTTIYIITVNDGFCSVTDSVTASVNGGTNTVFGQLTYENTFLTAMDNTQLKLITLSGIEMDSVITDVNGNYNFIDVVDQSYIVEMECNKSWGGVNASDGLAIMRHFVGMNILTGLKVVAADVDGSNFVNTTDALMCVQRFVGLINSFPVGDWVATIDTLIVVGGSIIQYNPTSLCYGDVDASYVPPSGKKEPSIELINDIPLSVETDDLIVLPVYVDRDMEIGALSLIFSYPDEFFDPVDVSFDKVSDDKLLYNSKNGELRIGWYNIDPVELQTGDVLITIKLKIKNVNSWPADGLELTLDASSEIADKNADKLFDVVLKSNNVIAGSGFDSYLANAFFYPNPFSEITTFSFNLPESSLVSLSVYNLLGEEVCKVASGQYYEKGDHNIPLIKGKLTGGVYVYRFEAAGEEITYFASGRLVVL